MDKEKARLIFDKMEEIRKIIETEPNNTYFSAYFNGDYMSFINDPEMENSYGFSLIDGEIIKRVR